MMPRLSGKCNRCGACCMIESEGLRFQCANLRIDTAIGVPFSTFCTKYGERYDGMPIELYNKTTGFIMRGKCHKNSAEEEQDIINSGIRKGLCSLKEIV